MGSPLEAGQFYYEPSHKGHVMGPGPGELYLPPPP